MAKQFCDIAKAFRQWLLQIETIIELLDGNSNAHVIQTGTILGCSRPLIWYTQVGEDPPECMDPAPIYVPSRVALDVEFVAVDQEAAETLAGAVKNAIIQHGRLTSTFDFDGCQVCTMQTADHDASYVAKAPGATEGDYITAIFVELKT